MKKILIVVGTRPNFIKVTQFKKVVEAYNGALEFKIVHTGQHYNDDMSSIFFKQFQMQPDYFLNIEPASPNTQMAKMMLELENIIVKYRPVLMVVVGDVNSTFAAALTANKMGVKIAHIESGLRSFDRSMPEEVNRILTDEVTDYFFVTEQSGVDHLIRGGKDPERIFLVGNTMIDALVAFKREIEKSDILLRLKLNSGDFSLMTLHRPATVDTRKGFQKSVDILEVVTQNLKVVFPIHPRTLKRLESFNLLSKLKNNKNLLLAEPLDYFAFQKLLKECKFVLTDSGGIQAEATFYGVPCLVLRETTEHSASLTNGTSKLVSLDSKNIKRKIQAIEKNGYKKSALPLYWDGKTTNRIIEIISKVLI